MSERLIPWGDIEKRKLMLSAVSAHLQPIIDEAGIPKEQGELQINPERFTLFSVGALTPETDDPEFFRFTTRGYTGGFDRLPEAGMVFVGIANIHLPQRLINAKIGFGTRLVTAWEDAWQNQGITTVAALGVIQVLKVTSFWTKLGYQPGKRTSAHMYKNL